MDEMREQFRRSQLAKSALIEANLRLVVSNVRKILKFRTSKVDFADAFQDGIIGLSKACEKFDPKKGVRFATYANFWIKREVRRSVQTQQNVMRVPHHAVEKINRIKIAELILRDKLGHMPDDTDIAEHLGMQVEHFIFYRNAAREVMSVDSELKSGKRKGSAASGGGVGGGGFTLHSMLKDPEDTPLDNAGKRMLEHDVRRLIRTLSPREQAVIRLRFGLDDGLPQTLDSIAQLFSTNRDQVHRVEVEALAKLRQPYRCKSVQAYVSDLV